MYNIKDRLTLHVPVANYTNKHAIFNKGQSIGHIELSNDNIPQTSFNNLTTQKTLDQHVQPDTFTSPLQTLLGNVRRSLNQLQETFQSQFAQNEMSIRTTHLIKNANWHGQLSLTEFIPHCYESLWLGKKWNKLLGAQVIHSSHSSWSTPIIVVPKGMVEHA